MKKIMIGFLCTFCFVCLAFAGSKEEYNTLQGKGHWNPITIYNNTGTDIAYVMSGIYGGVAYGIQTGMTDVYHSGTGDEFASFEVGVCKSMPTNGGPCMEHQTVSPCVDGHYNADLIGSIQVNSLTSCSITCLDGGSTSCKQN